MDIKKSEVQKMAEEYAKEQNSAYTNDYYGFIAGFEKALSLFAVRQSLPSDVYMEIDIDKAYKCGERQSTFYKKNGTVILPRNYEGVDG